MHNESAYFDSHNNSMSVLPSMGQPQSAHSGSMAGFVRIKPRGAKPESTDALDRIEGHITQSNPNISIDMQSCHLPAQFAQTKDINNNF